MIEIALKRDRGRGEGKAGTEVRPRDGRKLDEGEGVGMGGEEGAVEGDSAGAFSPSGEARGDTQGDWNGSMVYRLFNDNICVIPKSSRVWGEVAVYKSEIYNWGRICEAWGEKSPKRDLTTWKNRILNSR
jgi:hypothetical protein